MYKTFLWNKITYSKDQLETKMEKVICNDKVNEVINEDSEGSCGLIFPF